jgi:hypothetical protein
MMDHHTNVIDHKAYFINHHHTDVINRHADVLVDLKDRSTQQESITSRWKGLEEVIELLFPQIRRNRPPNLRASR